MTKTSDLTISEAVAAFKALEVEIGSKCEIYPSINRGGSKLLHASIYPQGILARTMLLARADTWRDLVANCEELWAGHIDLHGVNITREMALAIIALTADLGECTDASLRAKFDAADIARYGEAACAQATEMASNGPFSIVKLTGANDAEAA